MTRRSLTCLALLCLAAPAAAAPPAAPPVATVVPVYDTTPSMLVRWPDLPDEDYYEVWRGVEGGGIGFLSRVSGSAATGQVVLYVDTTIDPEVRYQYLVRACRNPSDCVDGAPFTTSAQVVWPIGGGRRLVHGFNEVIATAAVRGTDFAVTGFHDGVDLGRTTTGEATPGDELRAPRGGVVANVNSNLANVDDAFLWINVQIGDGKSENDAFNHLMNQPMNGATFLPTVAVGDVVAPGDLLGYVGVRRFATSIADHVHFSVFTPGHVAPDGQNQRTPLLIFRDPDDLDPGRFSPELLDENGDGKPWRARDRSTGALIDYDHDTKPLSGDLDLLVEAVDGQGFDLRQAPIQLGYWIEGPLPASDAFDDVRSAARPYKLYDFRNVYFPSDPTLATNLTGACALVADIRDATNLGCRGLNSCSSITIPPTGCVSTLKDPSAPNVGFPFPELHHFIVTHATGDLGRPADVSANAFWRTAARDDGAGANPPIANYATAPITPNPMEARFPDGDYTIHVIASDLVHENVDLPIPDVRIENFPPFVKEIAVYADADGNPSSQQSADFPGCETELYGYKHPGNRKPYPGQGYLEASQRERYARAGQTVCVKVRFSESMDTSGGVPVALDPRGVSGPPPIPFVPNKDTGFSKTFNPNDTWTGMLVVAVDQSGNSDSTPLVHEQDAVLRVTARDLKDRSNAQRSLVISFDGTATANGVDENHMIKLDASKPTTDIQGVMQK